MDIDGTTSTTTMATLPPVAAVPAELDPPVSVPPLLRALSTGGLVGVCSTIPWLVFPRLARETLPHGSAIGPGTVFWLLVLAAAAVSLLRTRARGEVRGANPSAGPVVVVVAILSLEALAALSLALGVAACLGVTPREVTGLLDRAGMAPLPACALFACCALVMERLISTISSRPAMFVPDNLEVACPSFPCIGHALAKRMRWTLACMGMLFVLGMTRGNFHHGQWMYLLSSILTGAASRSLESTLRERGRPVRVIPGLDPDAPAATA